MDTNQQQGPIKFPLWFNGRIFNGDGRPLMGGSREMVHMCNAHNALVNALTLLVEKVEANGGEFSGYRDEIKHARAALLAAKQRSL